jgi:hypothetical protein
MNEKISPQAIEQYSERYTTALANRFFENKIKISGPEILSLSEVKQVNLFVIRELMHLWTQESEKLKSPYFDYQAEEVKEILVQYQNILSNHISISKADFLPLLRAAVGKTINLILSPYDFYSQTLDRHGKGYLKKEVLKNEVKYLKINKAPLERLLLDLEKRNSDLVTGNEAFGILDHILEEVNFSPEEFEGYAAQFSQLVPLRIEQLYEVKQKVQEPPKQPQPLHQSTSTLKGQRPTIAEDLAKQKLFNLKQSLTINQKFMFTKVLFSGDFEIFSEAIDKVDSCATLNHALAYLGEYYPEWDRESEEYEEFIEVLTKRFS